MLINPFYILWQNQLNFIMNPRIESRLKKMDNDLTKLFEELKDYSEKSLNEKPGEGKWSVMQIMHHLILAEGGSIGYVKKKLSFNPTLEKAGLKASLNRFIVINYLKLPFKVKAPDGIGGANLPEHSNFWETAKLWKQQRQELQEYLISLPDDFYDKELYKHPASGKMKLVGMLDFFEQHFKRHRKQINKILAKSYKMN